MKLSNLKEARHVSSVKKFQVNVNIDKDLVEQVKSENVLARSMTDNEVVEHITEYLDHVSTDIAAMMEQLDWFNY